MDGKWVSSRFNAHSSTDGSMVLYNSFTGAVLMLPPGPEQVEVESALRIGFVERPSGVMEEMVNAGIFVPEGTDEECRMRMVQEVEAHPGHVLNLTILPTEQCNFRCTYCYEEFPHGAMAPSVREGLKQLVAQRARRLNTLSVSWFGGEPLLAPHVVRELTHSFQETCARHDVHYYACMTTNGYFLEPERIPEILSWQIKSFQITLDGPADTHNARRKRADGAGTFDRIIENLSALAASDADFTVMLRMNFDQEVVGRADELLDELATRFRRDDRFTLWPTPVGDWGGPNSGSIQTCSTEHVWSILERGVRKGLCATKGLETRMRPHGSVCYASNPHALVIGADGRAYKCTVALTDERNHVGWLHEDGRLDLDMDRMAPWVTCGDGKDGKCRNCFYQPACLGKACPLNRMRYGEPTCPPMKAGINQTLKIFALEANYDENEVVA